VCGIAGVVAPDHGDYGAFVRSACHLMAHRGPDEQGYYQSPGVAIGICRLSIIGGRGGSQPAYNADRSTICVFNGEIYNHRALRSRMERLGHRITGTSDAHVIPALYDTYGDDLTDHLLGMFAIAIYDTRAGELKLFTDQVGKKPIFYAPTAAGGLAFASELAPLATCPGVDRTIDPIAVDQYLSYRVVPAPRTIYTGLRKVPPASVLTFRIGRPIELREYWRFDFSPDEERRGDQVEEIDRLLRTAVAERLESEVPLGAMLSGGLDSSLVVAMATRASGNRIDSFSIGFEQSAFDESGHASRAAAFCGTRHHSYRIEPEDARAAIDPILRHMGEPYAFPSAIASYYMYRLAGEHVTVVLTGDGSDEIFGGYRRYKIFLRLPEIAAADSHRVDLAALAGGDDIATRYEAVLIDGVRTGMRAKLYSRAFLARFPDSFPVNYLGERFAHSEGQRHDLNRLLQLDCRFWLPDAQLVKIDRMAMAHSVEPRSPMLDHRLVQYVAGVAPDRKLIGDDEKAILKRVAARYLPAEIVSRPKQELAVPLEEWLTGHLRPLITTTLTSETALDRGIFNPDVLREMVSAFKPSDSYALWTLFMLERWHQLIMDESSWQPGQEQQLERTLQ
jgi:asparagine synthase (glutamine-hydrolysing)